MVGLGSSIRHYRTPRSSFVYISLIQVLKVLEYSNPIIIDHITRFCPILFVNKNYQLLLNLMMFFIMKRDNSALDINKPDADRSLTVEGSDWLWAATAVFGVTFLSWLAWTILRARSRTIAHNATDHRDKPSNHIDNNNDVALRASYEGYRVHREQVFHYLFTLAAFIGLISYFTMASDLGSTPIRQYLGNGTNTGQTRQVFYVRYIYWFMAWPLLLIANLLLSGLSWATILFAVSLQEIWVASWLSGSLVATSYRWGYFAFGLFAYFTLAYILLSWGIAHARLVPTQKKYTNLVVLLVVVWLGFPIAWGLSEGSNRLSITGEMIFYGILDIIAVPVYGTMFLMLSTRFDASRFQFTQVGRVQEIYPVGPHSDALVQSGV
jgi:bacteriorhodopsin